MSVYTQPIIILKTSNEICKQLINEGHRDLAVRLARYSLRSVFFAYRTQLAERRFNKSARKLKKIANDLAIDIEIREIITECM